MEISENMSTDNANFVKSKPKKRSLVERELETNLTAFAIYPANSDDPSTTSRYGRVRRLKTENTFDPEGTETGFLNTSNNLHQLKNMQQVSNQIETKSDNQFESISNENISLSRTLSKEKNFFSSSRKIYVRKDLMQKNENEETGSLIKSMFSPPRSSPNTLVNNILEKYVLNEDVDKCNHKNKSVVKILDFDTGHTKKNNREIKGKTLSKNEIFDIEAKCEYQVGDLAWSRVGAYPFWPCMVTREPTSELFVKKKKLGKVEHDVIHVTFFGDNGRRGWIVDNMLRKYVGIEEFKKTRSQITPEDKKRYARFYSAFFVSEKKLPQWNISVEEAERVLKEPKRLRIDILNDMIKRSRNSKTLPKRAPVARTNSEVSLSESLLDTLFSEDDRKSDDSDRARKNQNKSLDVSEVVTACLENMAAKTGISKIQRQSHMDRWLQKAKSKTPEKLQPNNYSVFKVENKLSRDMTAENHKPHNSKIVDSRQQRKLSWYYQNNHDHMFEDTKSVRQQSLQEAAHRPIKEACSTRTMSELKICAQKNTCDLEENDIPMNCDLSIGENAVEFSTRKANEKLTSENSFDFNTKENNKTNISEIVPKLHKNINVHNCEISDSTQVNRYTLLNKSIFHSSEENKDGVENSIGKEISKPIKALSECEENENVKNHIVENLNIQNMKKVVNETLFYQTDNSKTTETISEGTNKIEFKNLSTSDTFEQSKFFNLVINGENIPVQNLQKGNGDSINIDCDELQNEVTQISEVHYEIDVSKSDVDMAKNTNIDLSVDQKINTSKYDENKKLILLKNLAENFVNPQTDANISETSNSNTVQTVSTTNIENNQALHKTLNSSENYIKDDFSHDTNHLVKNTVDKTKTPLELEESSETHPNEMEITTNPTVIFTPVLNDKIEIDQSKTIHCIEDVHNKNEIERVQVNELCNNNNHVNKTKVRYKQENESQALNEETLLDVVNESLKNGNVIEADSLVKISNTSESRFIIENKDPSNQQKVNVSEKIKNVDFSARETLKQTDTNDDPVDNFNDIPQSFSIINTDNYKFRDDSIINTDKNINNFKDVQNKLWVSDNYDYVAEDVNNPKKRVEEIVIIKGLSNNGHDESFGSNLLKLPQNQKMSSGYTLKKADDCLLDRDSKTMNTINISKSESISKHNINEYEDKTSRVTKWKEAVDKADSFSTENLKESRHNESGEDPLINKQSPSDLSFSATLEYKNDELRTKIKCNKNKEELKKSLLTDHSDSMKFKGLILDKKVEYHEHVNSNNEEIPHIEILPDSMVRVNNVSSANGIIKQNTAVNTNLNSDIEPDLNNDSKLINRDVLSKTSTELNKVSTFISNDKLECPSDVNSDNYGFIYNSDKEFQKKVQDSHCFNYSTKPNENFNKKFDGNASDNIHIHREEKLHKELTKSGKINSNSSNHIIQHSVDNFVKLDNLEDTINNSIENSLSNTSENTSFETCLGDENVASQENLQSSLKPASQKTNTEDNVCTADKELCTEISSEDSAEEYDSDNFSCLVTGEGNLLLPSSKQYNNCNTTEEIKVLHTEVISNSKHCSQNNSMTHHESNEISKAMESSDFVEYLELRQDALMDNHPELTRDEIVKYLLKTWLYEENKRPECKNVDEIENSLLVKGLKLDIEKPKRITKKKAKLEKDPSFDHDELNDVMPKYKPKRKVQKPKYSCDFSDMEDEIVNYEIEESKSSESTKEISPIKENFKIVSRKSVVPSADVPEIIEVVDTEVDLTTCKIEDKYFQDLLLPKPNPIKGLLREKVCNICEKAGNLVKCKQCLDMFHVECINKELEIIDPTTQTRGRKKKKKPRGRKLKSSNDSNDHSFSDEKSQDEHKSESYKPNKGISEMESMTITNIEHFEAAFVTKMKELLDKTVEYDSSDYELDYPGNVEGNCEIVSLKLKSKNNKKSVDNADFMCNNCQKHDIPVCFVCKLTLSPKNKTEYRQNCHTSHCNKFYHAECLEHWPQTQFNTGDHKRIKNNPEKFEPFTCPRHVCHTCVCDDPRGCKTRFSADKLAKCVRCPATYHCFTKCLPAGTQILTGSYIVCPRHYDHRPGKVPFHVNTGWCFICARGGILICCEYCPMSFHAECLHITKPPDGNYMCEDCETGRLPLYGEMVWVKLGHYRWWPGLILHPNEIPAKVLAKKHQPGEFVVRFFGQYDYYWVNRGRVFPYQEGDTGHASNQKSKIDEAFTKAVEHAQRAWEILKNARQNEEESQELVSSLLPPQYVKLKVNKPVGRLVSWKPEEEGDSLVQCECDPREEEPCGIYSSCLNRMLLTECGPLCKAGERCQNRAFEKRQYPKLVPYRTPHRGWGLKTLEDIKQGQFVIEYVGELIDDVEFKRRMRWKHEKRDENYYFLVLDKDRMIDAGPKGNLARFMNHCCEPNCVTQKWTVLGDVRVGLFAMVDIPAGSEVTFNYNLECAGIEKKRCLCGARRCSGYIGAKPKADETQLKKQGKRTYKKKKEVESQSAKAASKKKLGRPPKPKPPKELSEIEKDLLIIKNAANGISSDSERSSRRSSFDFEKKDQKSQKRKRVSFSPEATVAVCGETSSPSAKRSKLLKVNLTRIDF